MADYNVFFPTTVITVTDGTDLSALEKFEIDGNAIYCYNVDEVNKLKMLLDTELVVYTETVYVADKTIKLKTKGVKYQSRTEIIKHVEKDAEPESQAIPNMKKALAEKDKVIKSLTDKYDSLEAKLKLKGVL
jgi:hypothetical protein